LAQKPEQHSSTRVNSKLVVDLLRDHDLSFGRGFYE
jgi:hypothetical protein